MTTLISLWIGSIGVAQAAEHHHSATIVYSDHRLSAGDLAQSVLQNNAGLQSRRFQADASKEQVQVVNRFEDPTFSYTIAPQSVGSDIGTRQIVQFSQPFPWPGKLDIEAEVSKSQANAAQFAVDDYQLSLIRESRSLWSMWWYLHQALEVNRNNQQLLEELQSVVSTQYAAGLGLQQDFLQVQTQQVHILHQEVVLKQQVKRLRAQINGLRNVEPNLPLPMPNAFPNLPGMPATDELMQWLVASHPQLQNLQAQTNAAMANIRLADAEDYPDFRLNATYNDLLEPAEKHLQIGVSVNLPFSFARRKANKSVQKYRYQSASADFDDNKKQLLAQLQSNIELVAETQSIIDIYQSDLIPKTQQTLEATKADYQAGRGQFANVIIAEQQLLSAQLELAQSRQAKLDALATISELTGGRFWPLSAPSNADINEEVRHVQ